MRVIYRPAKVRVWEAGPFGVGVFVLSQPERVSQTDFVL